MPGMQGGGLLGVEGSAKEVAVALGAAVFAVMREAQPEKTFFDGHGCCATRILMITAMLIEDLGRLTMTRGRRAAYIPGEPALGGRRSAVGGDARRETAAWSLPDSLPLMPQQCAIRLQILSTDTAEDGFNFFHAARQPPTSFAASHLHPSAILLFTSVFTFRQ